MPYEIRRPPRREIRRLRGLDIQLTRWGPGPTAADPPVVLLHGWQDTAETFQFMVDAFKRDWSLLALDWRGFGHSEWPQNGYWFPDYLADLEALLDECASGVPLRLVGHSMGGNVASLYAGLRPERIRCVVNLEGFGMPRSGPGEAPVALRKWLDQVKSTPSPRYYDSLDQLAAVIRYRYPRFTESQAEFVAAAWSTAEDGRVRLLGDTRHRWANPVRYRRDDAEACWREIKAPMLLLLGELSQYLPTLGADGSDAAFRDVMPDLQILRIPDAGHMLHIEQAWRVASAVESFLDAH